MTYDLGDVVPLGISVRNDQEQLVNASAVTLTITQPDGVALTPSPANPSTGQYIYDFLPTQEGRHSVRWTTTTPNTAYVDEFDVRAAATPSILSLLEAKRTLNMSPTVTKDDEELRAMLLTVSETVESIVGPVSRRAIVEDIQVSPGTRWVALSKFPIIEIATVDPVPLGYTSYVTADLVVRPESGLVRLALDTYWPCSLLRFSYTVGRAVVPESVRTATGIILEHMWRTQRGWQSRPTARGESGGGEGEASTYLGFALPNRAVQLLESNRQVVIG